MTIELIKEIAKEFAQKNGNRLDELSGGKYPGLRKHIEKYTESITISTVCETLAYLSSLPINEAIGELAEFTKDLAANGEKEGLS